MGKYYHRSIPDFEIEGVCYDTRRMEKNSVFVCIKGEQDDGHRYAVRAAELGARIVIASRHIDCRAAVILTNDTKAALQYMVKRFYGEPKLRLFGITGTNGKTTVSYMMSAIFSAAGISAGIIGTNGAFLNGEVIESGQSTPTTPNMPELYKTLSKMERSGAEVCVMEVSSHALAQDRVNGLKFETSVFTNLTQDHLDYHKDMEDYFAAKCRLFDISDKTAVNADDSYGKRIIEKGGFVGYGIECGEVRAEEIKLYSDGSEFDIVFGRNRIKQRINIPGLFSIYNALAAATACYISGIDTDSISAGLRSVGGVFGRMERIEADGVSVVIDYAHTPDGLLKVLTSLKDVTGGRVICLFGCGGDRDRTKRAVMGNIATEFSDLAIITSDNPRTESPTEIIIDILTGVKKDNYIVVENREKAIRLALGIAKKGDTLLLAGKGQERYQIIGKDKIEFDEREIIKRILTEQNGESYAGIYS